MSALLASFALSALLASTPVAAQTSSEHDSHHADPRIIAAASSMSDGEVRKVDKAAAKVTIKHGPLQNLEMPPSTMVFRIKVPAMLEQLKERHETKFAADKIDGVLTVTDIQTSK